MNSRVAKISTFEELGTTVDSITSDFFKLKLLLNFYGLISFLSATKTKFKLSGYSLQKIKSKLDFKNCKKEIVFNIFKAVRGFL